MDASSGSSARTRARRIWRARSACSTGKGFALPRLGPADLGGAAGLPSATSALGARGRGGDVSGATDHRPVRDRRHVPSAGRLRHFALPHCARRGQRPRHLRRDGRPTRRLHRAPRRRAPCRFGGRLGLSGLGGGELDVTARGEDMRLRYPEEVRSVGRRGARTLRGHVDAPVLSGAVSVKNARCWARRFDASARASSSLRDARPSSAAAGAAARVRRAAPLSTSASSRRRRSASRTDVGAHRRQRRPERCGRQRRPAARLRPRRDRARRGAVRGPPLPVVTRGSLDFTQPRRASSRSSTSKPRPASACPGQTYRVTLRIAGTTERAAAGVHLRSAAAAGRRAVAAACRHDAGGDVDLALAALAEPAASRSCCRRGRRARSPARCRPRSARWSRTPSASTPSRSRRLLDRPLQQAARLNVNPAARVTIGKRISDRIYLTYARSLRRRRPATRSSCSSTTRATRSAWVLSQNEDGTYALEVASECTSSDARRALPR